MTAEAGPSHTFYSLLFATPAQERASPPIDDPLLMADLNLDQVLQAMVSGRADYDIAPFFAMPLHETAAVTYRHQVMQDLEQTPVRDVVKAFAMEMRRVREHLAQADKRRYQYQKERWFLDGAGVYCRGVQALRDGLTPLNLISMGLRSFRQYVNDYLASPAFAALDGDVQTLHEQLASITYSVQIQGGHVSVSKYDGAPDYGASVADTFAKFRQGDAKNYLVQLSEWPDMNAVDARVLDIVALLYPEIFQSLDRFSREHADFLDGTISAFDRQVQFYLAYLELMAPLQAVGLPFCYPAVSPESKAVSAEDAYDLALARKLGRDGPPVVPNDFALSGPERVIVVTGPNQGGKTTFARMFGEVHYLASLGLPVPARTATLFLPDRMFTHFEREEAVETLRGKLEDELVRMREILGQATSSSIIIMNESFSSTTLEDSLTLGSAVLRQIIERGMLCVFVTFADELALLGDAVVSMVGAVVPENPAERTFHFVRKPPEGRAYAAAIAEKYGLTYEALQRRMAR